VVWEALRAVLEDHPPVQVLDVGGGTGGFAVRVAALGHHVTVVDPSPDALAILDRRSEETGVADRVVGVQGDLDTVPGLAPQGGVDVVLCHGVLERIEDHAGALRSLASLLREGGTLSLVVDQRHAAVVARAVAGHFRQARALLDPGTAPEQVHRFTVSEATRLLEDAEFTDIAVHGVRVFSDLVPSSLVDLEPGAAAALAELEHAVSELPEYHALATQLHLLATRR
jgi:2-polyprenyl-3-methyl-5-hydroxy-6-metoxy-1,4-benzoquinol methylase